MIECPQCGDPHPFEITTMGDVESRYLCHAGHSWLHLPDRPWRGEPGLAPGLAQVVYCGPAAHLPSTPSPMDLLRSAGLSVMGVRDGSMDQAVRVE